MQRKTVASEFMLNNCLFIQFIASAGLWCFQFKTCCIKFITHANMLSFINYRLWNMESIKSLQAQNISLICTPKNVFVNNSITQHGISTQQHFLFILWSSHHLDLFLLLAQQKILFETILSLSISLKQNQNHIFIFLWMCHCSFEIVFFSE